MAQLTDSCFAVGSAMLKLADALVLLDRHVTPAVDREIVSLRHACNRVLAEDLRAGRDIPACDNAAVDGYALNHACLDPRAETWLQVAGRAAAGHPFPETIAPGSAVRIFTGAAMPAGCDTVMMQEDCRAADGGVWIRPGIRPGANRRRAGEDVRQGETILKDGRRLRAQDIGLAAAAGHHRLPVYARLRAGVLSSGDELREPGQSAGPAEIYDANRYMLLALLETLGCQVSDLGILPDRATVIRRRLAEAAAEHDVILTSGGMSVGEEDHVKAAVQTLGSLHFWQLAIKPGRPLGLGAIGRVPFIGLPGNPVAVMVTFLMFARPMLLRLAGCNDDPPRPLQVAADFGFTKKAGRREWLRVQLVTAEEGARARRFPRQGSGILSSLVEADGLVELPEELVRVEPGMMVDFYPFAAFN